ncbi:unnamed protein product [Strongylus vulgaris]|uniref:Uncharacterized protein n=1 Tax=Strongylus vulgaris TaxID=40348 RepID=A0A3P7K557_STRVU|nr:unnamed protein product [Strongylus vulgaris]
MWVLRSPSDMLDIEHMDVSTLISALVGIFVIMVSSILYFTRKESQKLKGKDTILEEEEEEAAGDAPHFGGTKKVIKTRKNDQWKLKVWPDW